MKKSFSAHILVLVFSFVLLFTSCGNNKGFVVSVDSVTGMDCLSEYRGSETELVIPDQISSIGDQAFRDNTELVSVTFSENSSIRHIEESAFMGCVNLTSITIPDSVISIDQSAFYGCEKLHFNEYENAYYLGNEKNPYHALITAKSELITSCNIHPDTKIIAALAFEECTALKNITLPDGIIDIGMAAFSDCENLRYSEYGNAYYLGNTNNPYVALIDTMDSDSSLIIHSKTKTIADFALNGAFRTFTDVTIPQSVIHIGDFAFSNSSHLKNVRFDMNSQLTRIGNSAFDDCDNLGSITLPNNITSVGWEAFSNCKSMTSITLPDSLIYVGAGAFLNCNNLTIQCEAKRLPKTWHSNWNQSDCSVVWG